MTDTAHGHAVLLQVGARFAFDGELVEVMQIEGGRISVRDGCERWRTLSLTAFLSRALAAGDPAPVPALGTVMAALSAGQRDVLTERARHVREVLTGYRSGTADIAAEGEPRPPYAPGRSMRSRQQAKATELGVTDRTVRRWVQAYTRDGEAGLLDERQVHGRGSTVDPRWEQACRVVMAELVPASTPTASALLRLVEQRLDEQYGPGVVPRPSQATGYRHLTRLAKGTNAVRGSAKGRRSNAERPKGVYGRLRATRPGEYVILDTQSLDVFAMEPVTCRWLPAQLTVAQDLFDRTIIGMRVTPVSTKAVDVAGVLHQAVLPQALPATIAEEGRWPYHGLPEQVVFTENQPAPAGRVYAPETLVVDHGKAFLSAHIISVCTRLGISRPAGVTSHPQLIARLDHTFPPDVRAAVNGVRPGWLRLHRFQQAMAHPSLNIAATHTGVHISALVTQLQRLEADIGAQLFHRGTRSQPTRPTERGAALLDALTQPRVHALLHQHAKPLPGWKPDDRRRPAAQANGSVQHLAGYQPDP